jgi:hypothetical protein
MAKHINIAIGNAKVGLQAGTLSGVIIHMSDDDVTVQVADTDDQD